MGIKVKTGICVKCPEGSSEKPLTGKFYKTEKGEFTQDKKQAESLNIYSLCQYHYWEENVKKNQAKKNKNGTAANKAKTAKELNIFFASQLLEVPECCENCGDSLAYLKQSKMKKAIIAHILPKREIGGFPSVATHPKNKLFLCLECHTNMDTKGADFAPKMNCFDIMCERFKEFENELSESDKQRLPFYFKDLLNIKY